MLVVGGIVSGYASALMGVEACYILDSTTYFISAIIMSKVRGNFAATNDKTEKGKQMDRKSLKETIKTTILVPMMLFLRMNKELFQFLFSCGFGSLIFLKASGTMIWGAADVLNVSFSHVDGDEGESSRRLGILYR